MPLRIYEQVRANPRRFVIHPGHQHSELELVVEVDERYMVVEKHGAAGRVAGRHRSETVGVAEAVNGPKPELEAVTAQTLGLLVRKWMREREPVPVGLLADWFAVRVHVREQLPPPDVAATWFQVSPVEDATLSVNAVELSDFGEWVALVELLDEHAPELLQQFGYPKSVVAALESFASRIERGVPAESNVAVARALMRLANVCPWLAWRLREATHAVLASRPVDAPPETYVPRPLSRELTEILDAQPVSADRGHAIVRRVLRDL